jgi:DNA/RNA endonuclease YhcR with UshA esterase domain
MQSLGPNWTDYYKITKGETMRRSFPVLILTLFIGLAGAQTVTIEEAREDLNGDGIPDHLGEILTIEGIATCEGTLFSTTGLSFYVQDETAGINVYAYSSASPGTITAGERWRMTGEIKQYNGLVEISPSDPSDFVYIDTPGVPQPYQLALNQGVSEGLEGLLLAIGSSSLGQWVTVANDPESAGGGYNFNVWNGQNAVAVRVNETTQINVSSISAGTRLFIIGIGGQYDSEPPYDSGYQLLPRYQSDLTVYEPSISSGFHLTLLTDNPFAPVLGETLNMEYGGPSDMRFTVTVFDRSGRDVRHLADSRTAGDVIQWNGKNDSGEILPIGPYVVLLEGVDSDGKRFTTTETAVIAAPLN